MNPNWKQIVRDHLAVLGLPPEREIEIVEELALHLEAAYEAQQFPVSLHQHMNDDSHTR